MEDAALNLSVSNLVPRWTRERYLHIQGKDREMGGGERGRGVEIERERQTDSQSQVE